MKLIELNITVRDEPRPKARSAKDLWESLLKEAFDPLQEHFYLIPFVGGEVDIVDLFVGTLDSSMISTRIIMQKLLVEYPNCNMFAVAHNHPSGNIEPSPEDNTVTEAISKAAHLMRFRFVDHIVFTNDKYYSYRKEGRM